MSCSENESVDWTPGAGMENIVFMPRRSAVIEVFPFGIYCPLYTKLAATMQLQVSLLSIREQREIRGIYVRGSSYVDSILACPF